MQRSTYIVTACWFVLIMIFILIRLMISFQSAKKCDAFCGQWLTPEKDTFVIYEHNEKYYGRFLEFATPLKEEEQVPKDKNNQTPELRKRTIKGPVFLSDLQYNSRHNKLENGKIYLPDKEKKFSCILSLRNNNELEIKITVGIFSNAILCTKNEIE